MPGRAVPLHTGEIYHVFNRGVARQQVFRDKNDYHRLRETIDYYRFRSPYPKFSKFIALTETNQRRVLDHATENIVDIYAYCLMPNHFHLLVKQIQDKGIPNFVSTLTNSYTRFFNTKYDRIGPLFQGKFKAIRIEDDDIFLHVARYIHLNPYSGHVVNHPKDIDKYAYSSMSDYLQNRNSFIERELVMAHFDSPQSFAEFTHDQAEYQRMLHDLRHVCLES